MPIYRDDLTGPLRRTLARLVDLAVVGIPVFLLLKATQAKNRCPKLNPVPGCVPHSRPTSSLLHLAGVPTKVKLVVVVFVVAYEIGFVAVTAATPGKLVAQCRVLTREHGSAPGPVRALLRGLIPAIAVAVGILVSRDGGIALLVLDAVCIPVGGWNQALHDRIASTVVLDG